MRTAPPSDATIIHAAEASPTPPILVTTTCTAGLCIEQFNHEGPEKFVVQTNGTLRDLQRVLIDGDSQTKMKGKGCRLFASPTFPFNVCFEYFSVEAKVMMDPKKFNQSLFANSLRSHPRKPNVIIVAVLLKKAPQFPTAIVVLDETTKKIRWIHSRELADLFVDGYTFNSVEIVSDSLRDLIASKKKEFFELGIPEAHIPSPLYDPLVSLSIPGTLKSPNWKLGISLVSTNRHVLADHTHLLHFSRQMEHGCLCLSLTHLEFIGWEYKLRQCQQTKAKGGLIKSRMRMKSPAKFTRKKLSSEFIDVDDRFSLFASTD